MNATWEGLTPPYRTIVADPPWRYASNATKADANEHYSTMTQEDICALPVAALADESCHLWLWATNGRMEEAHQVCRAWGFRPLTILTWCKPRPGVGYYLRNNTEHCILASVGKPMVPEDKPLSTWYLWTATSHSSKPPAFYDLVEQVSPGPFVDVFCRAPRFGWDSWGFGYESFAAAVPSPEARCHEWAFDDETRLRYCIHCGVTDSDPSTAIRFELCPLASPGGDAVSAR